MWNSGANQLISYLDLWSVQSLIMNENRTIREGDTQGNEKELSCPKESCMRVGIVDRLQVGETGDE